MQDRVAARNDGVALAKDGDDVAVVGNFELAQGLTDDGRFRVQAVFHQLQPSGVKVEHGADAAAGQLRLNNFCDDRSGADGDVHPQALHRKFVAGILHAGDGLGDTEELLGDLAGDQVVFVVVGHGHKDVGSPGFCLFEYGTR